MDELLTPLQAAEYLHLHVGTLANRRSRGEEPTYIKVGGSIRYPKSALIEWLDAHVVRAER